MKIRKKFIIAFTLLLAFAFVFAPAATAVLAETGEETAVVADNSVSVKAIGAVAIVGVVATAGAIGMAMSICKSAESMARQPEAAGKINSAMMLGLVFIETAIIYALIIAILIIFVL